MTASAAPRGLATFVAADRHFALEVDEVLEVVPMVALIPVLGARDWLAGQLDLHGLMVPVVDLRLLLGLPRLEPGLGTPLVLTRSSAGPIGVIVDEVGDVVACDDGASAGALPATSEYADAFTDAVRIGGVLVLVLDSSWLAGVIEAAQ